jgi:hypothetical protein
MAPHLPPVPETPARSPATREGADAAAVRERLGPGRALEPATRARMEVAFGRRFDAARVHDDAAAAHVAAGEHSRALAVGDDVAFAPGEYRPGTPAGDALLAHELAHVAQQASPAQAPASGGSGRLDEREADRAAAGAVTALYGGGGREAAPRMGTPGGGLKLRRCPPDTGPAPAALKSVGDPTKSATFEDWLKTFPPAAGVGTSDITASVPKDLHDLIAGAAGVPPDCADVSLLLRHYWLKANGKSFTVKVGKKSYTIGAGVSDAQIRACMVDTGSIHFQEDRKDHRLVKFYKKAGVPILNLKQLIAAGLKPGDVMVWKRLPSVTGSGVHFEGHVQTVQNVDVAGQKLTVVQGNMSGGVGVGALQQKQLTFLDLTGAADGDANILDRPPGAAEESFFGAGPWME